MSMRTVRGPVVVVFYRGPEDEEDVEYLKALAGKEDEINLAAGSVVGVGVAGPDESRELTRKSGMKSYVLYDYTKAASRDWGLLEKDKQRGEYARPAVFIVGPDHKIAHAWTGERPDPAEILAKVSGITGLPKPDEEEKPGKTEEAEGGEKPKKMSAEERERIKAERRAAREAGKSLKTGDAGPAEKPERTKLTPEEREKRRAERQAARDAKAAEEAGTAGEEQATGAGETKPAAE